MSLQIFFFLVLASSFVCIFWAHAASPKNIFGFVYEYLTRARIIREYTDEAGADISWDEVKRVFYIEYSEYIFPVWLLKPLVLCVPCFAGPIGTLTYVGSVLFGNMCEYSVFWHILICCVTSGVVKLLWTIISYYERH